MTFHDLSPKLSKKCSGERARLVPVAPYTKTTSTRAACIDFNFGSRTTCLIPLDLDPQIGLKTSTEPRGWRERGNVPTPTGNERGERDGCVRRRHKLDGLDLHLGILHFLFDVDAVIA